MRVVKPQSVLVHFSPTQLQRRPLMGISVGVGFRLSDPRVLKHEAAVWHAVNSTPASLPLHELSRPKRHAEWMLAGHTVGAFEARHFNRKVDWTADVRLHHSQKSISAQAIATLETSSGCEARLLVDHSQAIQGPNGRNPLGKAEHSAPLQGLNWMGARDEPMAGMGPVDSRWADQMQWAPSFPITAIEMAAEGCRLGWPAATDFRFFQQAPADQWSSDAAWPPQALYQLSSFGPGGQGYAGRLPHLRAEIALQRRDAGQPQGLPLRQQTVWFLPDQDIGVMWWFGLAPLDHVMSDNITMLVAALTTADSLDDPLRLAQWAQRRVQLDAVDHQAQCDSHFLPPVSAGWTWEQILSLDDAPQESPAARSYEELRASVAQEMALVAELAAASDAQQDMPAKPAAATTVAEGRPLSREWIERLRNPSQRHLRHMFLSGQDLRGLDLSEAVWEQVRLEHCVLDGAQFQNCHFQHVDLVDCQLRGLAWHHTHWENGSLQRCNVDHNTWEGGLLDGLHWDDCQVSDCAFQDMQWQQVTLSQGHWQRLRWVKVQLSQFNVDGLTSAHDWHWMDSAGSGVALCNCSVQALHVLRCHIEKLSVIQTKLDHSEWERCRLRSATFSHHTSLLGSRWQDCELSQACWIELHGRQMQIDHCSFKQLNAQGMDAAGSRWTHTVLTGASFMNAKLEAALLEHSALRGANLIGCELHGSYAHHCNLILADLTDSTLPDEGAWHSNLDGGCITAPRRYP